MEEVSSPIEETAQSAPHENQTSREPAVLRSNTSAAVSPFLGWIILGFVLVLAAVAALGYAGYQEIQNTKQEVLSQVSDLKAAIQEISQQTKANPNETLLPELQKTIQAASQQTDGKIDQLTQEIHSKAESLTSPIQESLAVLSTKIDSTQSALEALQQKSAAPATIASEEITGQLQEIARLFEQLKAATSQLLEKQNENTSQFAFLGSSIVEKLDAQGHALADLQARLSTTQPPAAGVSAGELQQMQSSLSLAINEALYQIQIQLGQIQKVLSKTPEQ
ncbi:MAG TPA: hypothetical protein PLH79_05505 [bacterium]|nr:hypothetical protein [bacterium]